MVKITESCYKEHQSWWYRKVVIIDSHKLRVNIRRNAYDEQSYANVERWDGTKWQVIHDLPITDCACKTVSYVMENITASSFAIDADNLISIAMNILK